MIPSAAALAITFGLGCAVGTVERIGQGWGGHNMLWRLRTTSGDWAIKQVGRELGPDPDAAFAIELAAYAGGVRMPRPIPTVGGTCLATLGGGRYRCHEWLDGTALPWHGHTPQTVAAVGALLASLHRLRLPWSPSLAPSAPVFGLALGTAGPRGPLAGCPLG
jgi:Ser/Thr protein kinase RdoA (MazF antagonist)